MKFSDRTASLNEKFLVIECALIVKPRSKIIKIGETRYQKFKQAPCHTIFRNISTDG